MFVCVNGYVSVLCHAILSCVVLYSHTATHMGRRQSYIYRAVHIASLAYGILGCLGSVILVQGGWPFIYSEATSGPNILTPYIRMWGIELAIHTYKFHYHETM